MDQPDSGFGSEQSADLKGFATFDPMAAESGPRVHLHQPAPKRVSITVPYSLFHALSQEAQRQGRSVSNLAAFLLGHCLDSQ